MFKVTPFESKTLSWWRARREKIDMKPKYQRRGRLWSVTDKAYLIDSILNGFDIPKLYIADFTWGDSELNRKRLPYAIIDGKQRFEAIFDFYDGKLVLNEDFVLREDPTLELSGLSYKDLQSNYREIADVFDTFNLAVMSVITNDEELINELFVRLNRSKPLTGAEFRNAMVGPAPKVIREISQHEFFSNNIAFGVQRGQDLNTVGKMLMFEYFDKPVETKKKNIDAFVKMIAAPQTVKAKLELAVRRVVDGVEVLSTIFLPKDPLLSSSGLLPVYYWFVRGLQAQDYSKVREFLHSFEEARKRNRELVAKAVAANVADKELVEYDNYNRSTNDLLSYDGRIRILRKRFGLFITGQQRLTL